MAVKFKIAVKGLGILKVEIPDDLSVGQIWELAQSQGYIDVVHEDGSWGRWKYEEIGGITGAPNIVAAKPLILTPGAH